MTDAGTFKVSYMPDAGDFAEGRLAWDVLHKTSNHSNSTLTCIDLFDVVHLKPYALASLYSLGLCAKQPINLIPPRDKDCHEHLVRIGFCNLEMDQNELPVRDTNIRIRQLETEPGAFSADVFELWSRELGGMPPGIASSLADHLDEVILNAIQHADSTIGCVVVGQAFPTTGKVEIAVLDLGITIPGHLRQRPEYNHLCSDADAIIKATEEGVTGASGITNSGVGLYELKSYCRQGHGEMAILSGSSIVVFGQAEHPIIHAFRGNFQGTLVNLRFSTRPTLTRRPGDAIVSW